MTIFLSFWLIGAATTYYIGEWNCAHRMQCGDVDAANVWRHDRWRMALFCLCIWPAGLLAFLMTWAEPKQ